MSAAVTNMYSPSKNQCLVRVPALDGANLYRHDPYRASVLQPLTPSPIKTGGAMQPEYMGEAAQYGDAAYAQYHPYDAQDNQCYMPMPTMAFPHMMNPLAFMPPPADVLFGAGAAPTRHNAKQSQGPPPPNTRQYSDEALTNTSSFASIPTELSGDLTSAATTVSSAASGPKPEPKKHWASVQFKHATAQYEAPFRVSIGDHIMVEGDRGEHMGIITEITTVKPEKALPSKVLRRAKPEEKEMLATIRRKEATTTKSVAELAETLAPQMKIIDTEYQFDGNKLTIFYTSKGQVDFRKLQRSVFREVRCRIWLVNWNELHSSRSASCSGASTPAPTPSTPRSASTSTQ